MCKLINFSRTRFLHSLRFAPARATCSPLIGGVALELSVFGLGPGVAPPVIVFQLKTSQRNALGFYATALSTAKNFRCKVTHVVVSCGLRHTIDFCDLHG